MASLTDLVRDSDLQLADIQRKLEANAASLRRIEELEAKLAAIKARSSNTLADIRQNTQDLQGISSDLKAIPKALPTVSSATAEMKAADELADALEKGGLRLKKKLPGVAASVMKKPRSTLQDLRDALVHELNLESGKMAPYMARFLGHSLGVEFTRFAQADWGIAYGAANDMVSKIVRAGVQEAGGYSGTLSRFVLDQVDRTQDATRFSFTRHVEARACDWCKAQVAVYETTRKFYRHSNCRCMKVRR